LHLVKAFGIRPNRLLLHLLSGQKKPISNINNSDEQYRLTYWQSLSYFGMDFSNCKSVNSSNIIKNGQKMKEKLNSMYFSFFFKCCVQPIIFLDPSLSHPIWNFYHQWKKLCNNGFLSWLLLWRVETKENLEHNYSYIKYLVWWY